MNKDQVKSAAYEFLRSLERKLASELPPPSDMRSAVRKIVASARNDAKRKHMRQPEDAFLYNYAVPMIFSHMQTVPGIEAPQARDGFLSEYHRNIPQYCFQTPARTILHPFAKTLGAKPAELVAQWSGKLGAPLKQACPDFAFHEPFPHKILFEGKYFEKGSAAKAQTDLASCIYQAFYYRGLPYVQPKKTRPAWDYDFACLLAYDASESGNLLQAWNGLSRGVRKNFWDGANLYVMILRGRPSVPDKRGSLMAEG